LPVALKHQLISPYTSFVAVEQRISRPHETRLKKHPVPNLRPRGQTAQTYAWPRTATPAALQLLSGLVALLVAMFLLGSGGWIHLKAELAQVLIARAWSAPLSADLNPAKPWPWADTHPIARIQVPGHKVDQYVLAGQQGNALAFGPGHVSESALPGQPGTTIIAGHRDTHFDFIRDLQDGDRLSLTDREQQQYQYQVVGHYVADSDTQSLQGNDDDLLLVTCYPFDAINPGGPLRYVVRARQINI
jgi:sortase A